MRVWRVVKALRSNEAFTADGAFRYGGRWNSPGQRLVYCSQSKALALLEVLVHIDPMDAPFYWTGFQIEFRREQVERAKLPEQWQSEHHSRIVGDEWLRASRSLVLEVPSVVVPEEANYLLNPLHPDFRRLDLTRRSDFNLDLRLFQ